MKTFFSIDIDYWNRLSDHGLVAKNLKKLSEACEKHNVKITAVTNHQQMLPLVNEFQPDQLINIDDHSDLADNTVEKLECGTWISYVKNRNKSKYKWIHRCVSEDGCCNGGSVFKGLKRVNFKPYGNKIEWAKVVNEQTDKVDFDFDKIINKEGVREVCVCMSPSYSDEHIRKSFRKWVKDHNVPFKKGRKRENNFRRISPPKVK